MGTNEKGALVALRDERERTIGVLSDHFAKGTLEIDEFERRLTLAHSAGALAELQSLTSDLEPVTAPQPVTRNALVPASQVRETQSLVAIMGGTTRKGRWQCPRRLQVLAVMGGAELDFRDAVLAPGVTEVHIFSMMGGVEITVPPTLAVDINGIAIMGGFDHVERVPPQADPDMPVLRITGFVLMGGVGVETRLPGESRQQARKRRRKELRAHNA